MNTDQRLSRTIDEYRSILKPGTISKHNWEIAAKSLVQDADWTWEGAICLCELAEQYGSFVLRNAFALAVVMNQEDGSFGM
jgi:hypothetical protein